MGALRALAPQQLQCAETWWLHTKEALQRRATMRELIREARKLLRSLDNRRADAVDHRLVISLSLFQPNAGSGRVISGNENDPRLFKCQLNLLECGHVGAHSVLKSAHRVCRYTSALPQITHAPAKSRPGHSHLRTGDHGRNSTFLKTIDLSQLSGILYQLFG